MGQRDHRQMNFSLSEEGVRKLEIIKCNEIEIPNVLKEAL